MKSWDEKSWNKIRNDFPILKEKICGHDLIYLDNAATTQMPEQVIDAWSTHYRKYNANVHRGIHTLSELSTDHMESVRDKVQAFLNAAGEGTIVFTSGATDSANLVAESFLKSRLKPGDAVVSTELEHHSNYVVWQQLCRECGAEFRVIPVLPDGDLDMEAARRLLDERVKLLAVTAVSNVLGTAPDLPALIGAAHAREIPVYVDAAQAMRHFPIDLSVCKCDFLGFSSHKMMGPAGVGCLFIRNSFIDQMGPYRYGGGMVDLVRESGTTFAKAPALLEAGTLNYSGIIAFGAALDYLQEIGLNAIHEREGMLTRCAEEALQPLPGLQLLGAPDRRMGVLSFIIDGVHPYDLASFLDKYGVAVRSGSMCAQPIVNRYGVSTVTRISPAFYNTPEELERTAQIMNRVIALLRKR